MYIYIVCIHIKYDYVDVYMSQDVLHPKKINQTSKMAKFQGHSARRCVLVDPSRVSHRVVLDS